MPREVPRLGFTTPESFSLEVSDGWACYGPPFALITSTSRRAVARWLWR
jgi:hypothetical protein